MSPPTFPTISISPFLTHPISSPPTLSQKLTAQTLSAACAHPGFFYLTHHNLPPTLTSSVLSLAREFFLHASAEEKERIKRRDVGVGDGDGARGYQVVGDNITEGKRDWHEAVDWYRPVGDEGEEGVEEKGEEGDVKAMKGHVNGARTNGVENHRSPPFALLQGLNQWPMYPPSFRKTYASYIAHMLTLGTAVVRAMGLALGGDMTKTFVENTRRSFWVMRAIGYPPLPPDIARDETGGVSCGAHSDYGCLTLLLADETKGALQAWVEDGGSGEDGRADSKGGQWVNIDPKPGALVVNIGDMMERWSGGKWKATRHRVVHKGGGYRVSVPFFFEPDWDAKVPGLPHEGEVMYGKYLEAKVRGNF
ncbi:hypothetical protein ACLMJK_007901 [Lecanora helva]